MNEQNLAARAERFLGEVRHRLLQDPGDLDGAIGSASEAHTTTADLLTKLRKTRNERKESAPMDPKFIEQDVSRILRETNLRGLGSLLIEAADCLGTVREQEHRGASALRHVDWEAVKKEAASRGIGRFGTSDPSA